MKALPRLTGYSRARPGKLVPLGTRITSILLLLAACAMLSSPAPTRAGDKIDKKLIARSRAEGELLWRRGFTIEDSTQQYLQVLLDSLTLGQPIDPDISLTVKIFRGPELNAFAMPDGSIYLFVGLLSRIQLHFLLCYPRVLTITWHEGGAVIGKTPSHYRILEKIGSVGIGVVCRRNKDPLARRPQAPADQPGAPRTIPAATPASCRGVSALHVDPPD